MLEEPQERPQDLHANESQIEAEPSAYWAAGRAGLEQPAIEQLIASPSCGTPERGTDAAIPRGVIRGIQPRRHEVKRQLDPAHDEHRGHLLQEAC